MNKIFESNRCMLYTILIFSMLSPDNLILMLGNAYLGIAINFEKAYDIKWEMELRLISS